MATFVNTEYAAKGFWGMAESSRLISTDVGRIHDCLTQDEDGNNIDVSNGTALKIGSFTGDGLQERYATIAGTSDRIGVVIAPVIIKDAMTKGQNMDYNFYIPAGTDAKTYEVRAEDDDIFAVAQYQFTDASAENIEVGNYVVVDGNGMWVAQTAEPDAAAYGFIGKIHSLSYDSLNLVTMVRILAVQNVQL